jgi:hypothetical protein
MKIKNHDDFPKLDHRTAPILSEDTFQPSIGR